MGWWSRVRRSRERRAVRWHIGKQRAVTAELLESAPRWRADYRRGIAPSARRAGNLKARRRELDKGLAEWLPA